MSPLLCSKSASSHPPNHCIFPTREALTDYLVFRPVVPVTVDDTNTMPTILRWKIYSLSIRSRLTPSHCLLIYRKSSSPGHSDDGSCHSKSAPVLCQKGAMFSFLSIFFFLLSGSRSIFFCQGSLHTAKVARLVDQGGVCDEQAFRPWNSREIQRPQRKSILIQSRQDTERSYELQQQSKLSLTLADQHKNPFLIHHFRF